MAMDAVAAILFIRPCSSLLLVHDNVNLFWEGIVGWIVLGMTAALSLAFYVFYPACANAGGGLGNTKASLTKIRTNTSPKDPVLSIVIPAYNEAQRLPGMLDVTLRYLDTNRMHITKLFHSIIENDDKKSSITPIRCEFIIVNDGSTDDTENIVHKYSANVMNGDTFNLVSMHNNCGKGGAVKTGMLHSSGQLCLMIDADGATDISDGLPKVLREMKRLLAERINRMDENDNIYTDQSHYSLPPMAVFGSRAHLEEESTASRSKVRTLLMHSFHFFVKVLCSSRIKDTQCGFKLFTRSATVLLFTNLHLRRWAFDTEVVVIGEKLGVSISEVAVIWHEVEGSKLAVSKFALLTASVGMLRDMVCVRACYFFGIWKLLKR